MELTNHTAQAVRVRVRVRLRIRGAQAFGSAVTLQACSLEPMTFRR